MKRILFIILLFAQVLAFGQSSLGSLNLNYLYDPQNEINFQLKPIRSQQGIDVYFELKTLLSQYGADSYTISWEKRATYSQRTGEAITPVVRGEDNSAIAKKGWLTFSTADTPWLLLARVKNNTTGKNWTFHALISPKYPVNGYLEDQGQIVTNPFIDNRKAYTVRSATSATALYGFYYKQQFPAGSPPFAEKDASADRFMFADSTFTIAPGAAVTFKKEGLYLLQADSTSSEGFAFRAASSSYPRYTRMEDLPAPMVFVTTKEEYDELLAAHDEKTKFDKVILDITRDRERAKTFMRSYFGRIELANQYFTSYKEGWKTDRGMIYLIFGLPTEVSRNDNTEIWYYKSFQARFTFVRNGSVYDPNTYVLKRDKRFTETWYSTIDLWRKSRF